MAKIVMMPKLGMTMTEGTICEWKKKEGEHVSIGDDLFEVETDKLTNTVKAMDEGVLAKIVAKEGDTVP